MKRQILTCLAASTLCGLSAHSGADGFATWNANSGGFSYVISNLSGMDCYLTAYGATPNTAAASGSLASSQGWNSNNPNSPEDAMPGFFGLFNDDNHDLKVPGLVVFYGDDSPMQKIYAPTLKAGSWVPGSPNNYPYSPVLYYGESLQAIEPTTQMGSQPNPAAAGDSWSICCGGGCSVTNPPYNIVMANLASAGDSLGSGLLYDAYDYFVSNALINPPAPGSCDSADTKGNACGMGFVGSEQNVFNLNQNPADGNYVGTGGLWLGVENPNTQGPKPQAVYSLVPSMFPVNLASYTQAQQENNNGNTQWQTDIYGAHLTFAIGDPFVISSIAAKTLWALATSSTFSLDDVTFSQSGAGTTAYSNAVSGLFSAGYVQDYVNMMMTSTAQAGYVVSEAINAASQANEHEKFWGKVFSALFKVTMTAIDVGAAVATGGASEAAQVGIQTAVNTATGALGSPVDNAINNAFTSNTTAGTPVTQTAPPAYNSTFASTNLLGLMLTDFYVQYQVNEAMGITPTAANPLWSNAAMYTAAPTNELGNCTNLAVTGNNFDVNVECYGGASKGYVQQSAVTPQPAYTNVCESVNANGCANAGTTYNQLNIWDAVMTGSTVGADANGMLQIQNPATWSFQPPTLINDSKVAQVSTNFNLNTGALTLTEYWWSNTLAQTQPTIISATVNYGGGNCESLTYSPLTVSYDATTGMLSTAGWQSGCEADPDVNEGSTDDFVASLNMATCQTGSAVEFLVSGGDDWRSGPSSVSLECVHGPASVMTDVVLNYNACVSDQNATGGVVVMNMSANQPSLACVCVPDYIYGDSTSDDLVTGSYSTGDLSDSTVTNPCPPPPNTSGNGAIASNTAGD